MIIEFRNITKLVTLLVVLGMAVAAPAWGAERDVGTVIFVKGEATVTRLPNSRPKQLSFKDTIREMDVLETKDGELKIRFSDRSVLKMAPHSKVMVTEHVYKQAKGERKTIFDVVKGQVAAVISKLPDLKINDVRVMTKAAVAGIRGTHFATIVSEKKNKAKKKVSVTQFLLDTGELDVWSTADNEHRPLFPGQMVTTWEGGPLGDSVEMSPRLRENLFRTGSISASTLSEVLSAIQASQAAQPSTQEGTSAATFGDTSTNPGAAERQIPEGVDEPPPGTKPGPNEADVRIPVDTKGNR